MQQGQCQVRDLGLIPYLEAWELQRSLVASRISDPDLPDILLLLEHPPVYTLGQGATLDYLKFDPDFTDFEVYRIERGGEVTYHCPGQLVGYPILNLRRHQMDLHWYLRQLEEVLIQAIATYGLVAERIPGLTGVWIEGRKVAAIGIKVTRWIAFHGFALNINPDLAGFEQIVPCGISDKQVASLAQFIPDINPVEMRQRVRDSFAKLFELELI